MAQQGRVWIVGAGPGDPGLLTRKAMACLRFADLVLYDALVDDRVVALARRAQRFFVGKRAGRHTLSQDDIHAIMIRSARRGRRVVRLKGGDPFVFGRGGEEALALRAAGVPFEVVPGVTSAVAAPAVAGIPVSHRGVATAFLVVSGHDEQGFRALIGSLMPHNLTLVVMMGFGRRGALSRLLIEAGWGAETPAAIVAEATLPTQREWRGTLRALAAGGGAIEIDGPATIIIGRVAGMTLVEHAMSTSMQTAEQAACTVRG